MKATARPRGLPGPRSTPSKQRHSLHRLLATPPIKTTIAAASIPLLLRQPRNCPRLRQPPPRNYQEQSIQRRHCQPRSITAISARSASPTWGSRSRGPPPKEDRRWRKSGRRPPRYSAVAAAVEVTAARLLLLQPRRHRPPVCRRTTTPCRQLILAIKLLA